MKIQLVDNVECARCHSFFNTKNTPPKARIREFMQDRKGLLKCVGCQRWREITK